jgi:aminoglycoside phosphotransferase (APT) family kinase protein
MKGNTSEFHLDKFHAWYTEHVEPVNRNAIDVTRLTGGLSNLTYLVHAGSRDVVVRRPPLGQLLATAHDMGRERTFLTSLAGSDVPVPAVLGWDSEGTVLGAPFFVMEKVSGDSYRQATDLATRSEDAVRIMSGRMVDVLAKIHHVDVTQVGLTNLGRPEGFLERQVRRWGAQLDASRTRNLVGLNHLRARLTNAAPPQRAGAIVHGDYRLDNLLVEDTTVTAVLDWELATIGDPASDLALLMVYQYLARIAPAGSVPDASNAPGFLSPPEVVTRYAQAGGDVPPDLSFHLGLATYKLVGILEGIHKRHIDGNTVGTEFESIGECVEPLIAIGLDLMKEAK